MLFSLRTSFKATLVNDDGTPRITAEVRNVTPDDIGKVAELVRDVFGTPSGTCRSDSAAGLTGRMLTPGGLRASE